MVPGTSRITTKTSVTTPSKVGRVASSRPTMYRCMKENPRLFDPALFEATQDHRRVFVAGVVDILAGSVEEIDMIHPDPVEPIEQDVLDLVVDLFALGRIPGVPPGLQH